jgi:hypothetical protein
MNLFSKFQRQKSKVITTALSGDQVKEIFDTSGFSDVTMTATNVLNIWPYVSNIPHTDYAGYSLTKDEDVKTVQRTSENTFDLVHVMTDVKNAFLVVVVDLKNDKVHGHFILDLNKEYGISKIN